MVRLSIRVFTLSAVLFSCGDNAKDADRNASLESPMLRQHYRRLSSASTGSSTTNEGSGSGETGTPRQTIASSGSSGHSEPSTPLFRDPEDIGTELYEMTDAGPRCVGITPDAPSSVSAFPWSAPVVAGGQAELSNILADFRQLTDNVLGYRNRCISAPIVREGERYPVHTRILLIDTFVTYWTLRSDTWRDWLQTLNGKPGNEALTAIVRRFEAEGISGSVCKEQTERMLDEFERWLRGQERIDWTSSKYRARVALERWSHTD